MKPDARITLIQKRARFEMAERRISERLIDEGHPSMIGKSISASPDCRRLAYVARVSEKRSVVVDGQDQKNYMDIEQHWIGNSWSCAVFSPDSRRLAYVARVGEKRFVVVDGQEQQQYDRIQGGSLVFSPDSQRLAYIARANRKWFVVVDGQEQQQYEAIGSVIFSPDSKRVAYSASGNLVVVDGQEGKEYAWIVDLVFSPDSKRVAYLVEHHGGWLARKKFVVVDGQEGKHYDQVYSGASDETSSSLVFSPDSQRLACRFQFYVFGDGAMVRSPQGFVVVDGQKGKLYETVGPTVFSPDSKRVAYVANRKLVVVDGQGGRRYRIEGDSVIFSPDSQRLAFVAHAGGKRFVVVDGHEQKYYDRIYDRIEGDSVVFSPDSQRLAFVAMVFARKIGFIKGGKKSYMVVFNGLEGNKYDGIVAPPVGGGVIFDSPNQLHYLARKGNAFCLVEESISSLERSQ